MASLSRPLEFAVVLYAGCLFGGPYRAARRIAARQGEVLRINIFNPQAKLLRKLVLIRTRSTSESSTEMCESLYETPTFGLEQPLCYMEDSFNFNFSQIARDIQACSNKVLSDGPQPARRCGSASWNRPEPSTVVRSA